MTTLNNFKNLLELSFHAYKMNRDPNLNPNRDNPNNLLDTIILLGTTFGSSGIYPNKIIVSNKLLGLSRLGLGFTLHA